MTPIDGDHAALLRGIARNLNDATARKVYADWLQERGNAGWIVVAHYPPEQWPVWAGDKKRAKNPWVSGFTGEHWRLPWLDGEFYHRERLPNPKNRTKTILLAYADGTVRKPAARK
jgi:uncharacterized protein (TIGR02996 family)